MNPDLEIKAALRKSLRTVLKDVSTDERAAASGAVCERLMAQEVWRTSSSILFYLPLGDELDLRPCIEEALSQGKTVAVPRYVPEEGIYRPAVLKSLRDDVAPGPFGILEPISSLSALPMKQLDLALVPGLGFSPGGCRLGRGKGFYDRLLTLVTGIKCGVALDQQVVQPIPAEPHDVPMNFIVTPTRWIVAGADS